MARGRSDTGVLLGITEIMVVRVAEGVWVQVARRIVVATCLTACKIICECPEEGAQRRLYRWNSFFLTARCYKALDLPRKTLLHPVAESRYSKLPTSVLGETIPHTEAAPEAVIVSRDRTGNPSLPSLALKVDSV